MRVVLVWDQVGPLDELAEPPPEPGLERGHGEKAAVRTCVDPVTRERTRQRSREPRELVRAIERWGMELVRELVLGYRPAIRAAPEQDETRAFLFRASQQGDS